MALVTLEKIEPQGTQLTGPNIRRLREWWGQNSDGGQILSTICQ